MSGEKKHESSDGGGGGGWEWGGGELELYRCNGSLKRHSSVECGNFYY